MKTTELHLKAIWDLAKRFVPQTAADRRLYESGPNSWWPAHEIGHFLVATRTECSAPRFGIEDWAVNATANFRYAVAKEIAATSISQRLLRRSGHAAIADDEIQYTDETTLECAFERWCKNTVRRMLVVNKVIRLPTTHAGLEKLLARKTRDIAYEGQC